MPLSAIPHIGERFVLKARQGLTCVDFTSVMLLQQVFYSVMYWSYVPLASLGVLVGVFSIKMPIEV